MRGSGLVEATERLYRTLFGAALGYAFATSVWAAVLAPFNTFHGHHARSVALDLTVALLSGLAFMRRDRAFYAMRADPRWLLVVTAVCVGMLWGDGGWHSTFYLASYSGIVLAAVAAERSWSLACGALTAVGYVAGIMINGYSWHELRLLHDAEESVANAGGYLIGAYFFASPVAWLGGYLARVNQVISQPVADQPLHTGGASAPMVAAPDPVSRRTASLSVREVEITQLVAEGLSNDAIAQRLFLSPRTVQSHVANALRKTGTARRTELAMLAVREGLIQLADGDGPGLT